MALRHAGTSALRSLGLAREATTATRFNATRAFGALVGATRATPPEQSMRPHKLESDPTHTQKWLYDTKFTPMDMIAEVPPMEIHGNTAVCYGGDNPSLGHPVEYIQLNDTNKENPATCKYCGLRYFEAPHH